MRKPFETKVGPVWIDIRGSEPTRIALRFADPCDERFARLVPSLEAHVGRARLLRTRSEAAHHVNALVVIFIRLPESVAVARDAFHEGRVAEAHALLERG